MSCGKAVRTDLCVGSDSSQTDPREIAGFWGERQARSQNVALSALWQQKGDF